MTIEVQEQETSEDLSLEFVSYGPDTKRLWIRDLNQFWQSIGWCPHPTIYGLECIYCSLNVE